LRHNIYNRYEHILKMDKDRQPKTLLNYKQMGYKYIYIYKHTEIDKKNNSLEGGTDQKAHSLKYTQKRQKCLQFFILCNKNTNHNRLVAVLCHATEQMG